MSLVKPPLSVPRRGRRALRAATASLLLIGPLPLGPRAAEAQETAAWTRPETAAATELAGVWSATRRFGPEVGGPLVLRPVTAGLAGDPDGAAGRPYAAEISGYHVMALAESGEIRFEIPGGRGRFRGRIAEDGRTLDGHWIQPWNYSSFSELASPVTLHPGEDGGWRGTVTPKPDVLRFHLKIEETEAGSVRAFLRNPEANVGRFYAIERVERKGDEVLFYDASGRLRLQGTVDEDFARLSVYFPLNGGTYDFVRTDEDPGSLFTPRAPSEPAYAYRRPDAGGGWETARPEDVGMDAGPLEALVRMIVATPMNAVDAPYIHGFLVARHGRLVFEEYFHGYSRHVPHGTRSASKTMTTTLVGIAEHAGLLDLDVPVYEAMYGGDPPAGLDPRARRVTLEHLITMTSGLACDDGDPESPGGEDRMQNQDEEPDWFGYTLRLPMAHEPGTHPAYCSGGQNLAGGVVSRLAGEWLPAFYQQRFARSVGAGHSFMNLTPTGEAYGGGGLYIEPRDFLKLGQLYLDGGVWKGVRLLDEEWVERALTPHGTIRDEGYGYGWWTFSYPFEGRRVDAAYAGGNGGQYLIIVPELDLAVVIFGGNYNQSVQHRSKYEYVPDYVLRSIAEGASGR